jgi:hypothetical protein
VHLRVRECICVCVCDYVRATVYRTSALVFMTSATTRLMFNWLSPIALKSDEARI